MVKPELLAPAGGIEQLRSALHFGADAVYMGGNEFGLRSRADAFAADEFERGIAYAHAQGVSVHVPVNILMHDRDIDRLPSYLAWLDGLGVDALIVSDLGALSLARRHAPHAQIHLSTQASCSNIQAALSYRDLGVKRIVLARELSLAEIVRMRRELPADLELEVFVHGAMCMAISGRCLISDYLTGRGGNHGDCAQPCRWNYEIVEPTRAGQLFPLEEDDRSSYLFNSRDLMMLEHLGELADAGIDAIKIEGRGKGMFYVATVVNAYRQVLDGANPAAFLEEMYAISHRPYGTGFYYGRASQADVDGYSRACTMVATVISCTEVEEEPASSEDVSRAAHADRDGAPLYRVSVLLRNRLADGEQLEALSPAKPIQTLTVKSLVHEGEGHVEIANRSMEVYSFITPLPLDTDDILRRRDDGADPLSSCTSPADASPHDSSAHRAQDRPESTYRKAEHS